MMKPGLPQGTRDFDAATLYKRNYIFNTIKTVFELYGFEPLETPAFENIETLMGKYGEEGDKLIFKIINNGLDNPAKKAILQENFEKVLSGKTVKEITERALRYDLTIPFARYVAMNHGQLNLPYKRYQMQPVWRADRPQRGRYREFYQCDADVVGSYSLVNDAEFASLYEDVFTQLKIPITIKINSRKILSALATLCGGPEKMMEITMAIDKLDKVGPEKVKIELSERGLLPKQIDIISSYLNIMGTNSEIIDAASLLFKNTEEGLKGIEELVYIMSLTPAKNIKIDLTLARGLNYYTGIIYEVKALGVAIGSIGGGGRYDDLTGLFGVKGIAGVGISFGLDRIFDTMEDLGLFPEKVNSGTQVLFFNMGELEMKEALNQCRNLRKSGISCEIFHEQVKMDKQFKYATRKFISYAVIIGESELAARECIVKNLNLGTQENISLSELGNYFIKKDI